MQNKRNIITHGAIWESQEDHQQGCHQITDHPRSSFLEWRSPRNSQHQQSHFKEYRETFISQLMRFWYIALLATMAQVSLKQCTDSPDSQRQRSHFKEYVSQCMRLWYIALLPTKAQVSLRKCADCDHTQNM